MKISYLKIENTKRISILEYIPRENVIIVGGKNGHGKTSTLDSIMMALGGKKLLTEKPVKEGADQSVIEFGIDDKYRVRRTTLPNGDSRLELFDWEGGVLSAGQTILNGLISERSINCQDFLRLEPKKQKQILSDLVGLDLTAINAKEKKLEEERLFIGRDLKKQEALFSQLPFYSDAPNTLLEKGELETEFAEINNNNCKRFEAIENRKWLIEEGIRAENEIKGLKNRIHELEQKVVSLKNQIEETDAKLLSLSESDIDSIIIKIQTIDEANAKILANKKREEERQILIRLNKEHAGKEIEIKELREYKQQLLRDCKFPIEGLSFSEDGLLFNGIPFSEAASFEKILVSAAIGMSLDPKLRILLIRDGSLLDDEQLDRLSLLASKWNCQCWVEKVGNVGNIILEEGRVKNE